MEKLREKSEYEGNPVGLSDNTAKVMARELDRHLSSFITLFNQYHKHHWMVEGPQFRDLHLFFEDHYTQLHEQYDAIAERLTVMGYCPTCHPQKQLELTYIDHEEEGVFRIREMLAKDMDDEKTIAIELRKTIKLALQHEDFATKALLEGILIKTEDRCHHIEHFLGDDGLSIGMIARPEDIMESEDEKSRSSKTGLRVTARKAPAKAKAK
ncbi:DNA starvation/stationary phase protection protein [Pontibacter sp. BT310]|jgi:starvation-inducible DNA-binding protein|uniref:DNA starvation/stationary phase protection protein n=1 Tax=Pontibacter populi TaxID=890055 RepID=A0ABS6XE29_9BACT|nr:MULTISPECIES: DNA starvation/stationary phase protection protein [Pontibacter]MBJ6119387.1 DNA starvation/stationary phase protection protein [Pontibacter sp. BT310]MBR0571815.1 DNA starvation/stationary phase protection protein [Microvirga sp. STS03]MBW3366241.1 DNA starvation/stationary phase protection protein [Pontibacter populi]